MPIMRSRNRALCLPSNYVANLTPKHFDDRHFEDEWQKEVYERAAALFQEGSFDSVCDIGCGSGFKFVKYFGGAHTIGYEVEPCLSHLRACWPERDWRDAADLNAGALAVDLIVCSDVIEHLLKPDHLLDTLSRSNAKLVVISTPELRLLTQAGLSPLSGPPANPHHVNEWTARRFAAFVSRHLDVVSTTITNRIQCTQMVVAKPKRGGADNAVSGRRVT